MKIFFFQPKEIVFRSFTEVIKRVGNKHYPVRGKKIDKIILKVIKGGSFTATLGNCIIKRVNNTIIVLKEY